MGMMFRNCRLGCCLQGGRAIEKREALKWADEYDNGHVMFMCPKDGLACTCVEGTELDCATRRNE